MKSHLIGIGGVGMSALAQALLDIGEEVSGSDRLVDGGDATPNLARLRAQGVAIFLQDGSGVRSGAGRVIMSTAIEDDNPDLAAARELGIPIAHRADALAAAFAGRRQLAIAGTCGKSSVTAMTGWLMAEAGLDPMVVNGAGVVGWESDSRVGSTRKGAGGWAVFEADESDRSLMAFDPSAAVITNASADHFPLAETEALFARFRAGVRGPVIDGTGEAPQDVALEGWSGSFTWRGRRFTVNLPGAHNVQNAWMALRAAEACGADIDCLATALASFRGIERRLERIGVARGVTVVDDYAHNPAKLSAAWHALAAAFPRVAALWRPHGYAPLRKLKDDLADAFAAVMRPADTLVLLPVYDAGGTTDRSINSGALADAMAARGAKAILVSTATEAEDALIAAAAPGTVVATMGARDPDLPRMARRILRRLGE